jgi:hypothetical protein
VGSAIRDAGDDTIVTDRQEFLDGRREVRKDFPPLRQPALELGQIDRFAVLR